MYNGGGGSTKTGKNGYDTDSDYRVGGSLYDPKTSSFQGHPNSQREIKSFLSKGNSNQHKSIDKKHRQNASSMLSDGQKDHYLDDYHCDDDHFEAGN